LKNVSISLRLTIWFSVVFLCGFIVFGIVMWADLATSLGNGRDRTLTRRAMRASELLAATRNDPPAIRSARYNDFADSTPEGNLIEIVDGTGRRLYPESMLAPASFPWPRPGEMADRFTSVDFSGLRYRTLAHPDASGSQTVWVLVGGQLQDNRQMLDRFETGLISAIPALLALSAMAGYFMSRRVLQPVDRLTGAVRSISIGNLSERLPIHQTGDELQRLAETCNEMLSRLEAAFTQIKRFTADASHELRSPLTFVRMRAEYALRNPRLDEDSRESFEEILTEATAATELLEDMLVLARADSGQIDVAFERIDLAALVREVSEKAGAAAEPKRHTLTVHGLDAGPYEIRGDRPSLRRLIWALLDNAVKYTPEGGRIEVALTRCKSEVGLTVRDSGIGIPDLLQPRIFDRFFRVDPARSQVDGAGLGLAIAKWIADAHDAVLSVESTEGEGSVFTAVFPAAM
jgi:heavy metal sensor kinase